MVMQPQKIKRWLALLTMSTLLACAEQTPVVEPRTDEGKSEFIGPPDRTLKALSTELGYTIGRGIDDMDKAPIRGDCFIDAAKHVQQSWTDSTGLKGTVSETRVTSSKQLLNALDWSLNAAVRGSFGEASANYTQLSSFTASEDTMTWVFSLSVVAGEKTIKNVSLTDLSKTAQKLIAQGKTEEFRKLCGTKYIRSIRYGGYIRRAEEFSAKAITEINKITAAAEYSGGNLFINGSLQAQYNNLILNASARSMFKKYHEQEGGKIIDYQWHEVDTNKIIKEFTESVSKDNSVVINIEYADWETIIRFPKPNPFAIDKRETTLKELLALKFKAKEKLEKIDQYLYLYEEGSIDLSPEQLLHLQTSETELKKQQESILDRGVKCYEDVTKCDALPTLPVVTFPLLILKSLSSKVTLYTDNWSYEYPSLNPVVKKSERVSFWGHEDILKLKDSRNNTIEIQLEIDEKKCTPKFEVENKNYNHELFKTDRVVAYYSSVIYPHNEQTVIRAVFKNVKTQSCLNLNFYPLNEASYSLADASEASRVVKSILLNVKIKKEK